MALELYANNPQTTTTGAINNSSDPVTFTVLDASEFPATGNFRILIDSEILLVTTVSGSDFTASRAQESTSIASHSGGATVTNILTAGSLRKIIGEFNLFDTYANRPTAGIAGRVFTPSDWQGVRYYDTGSAWRIVLPNGHIMATTSPVVATLPNWINQDTATFTQVQDFVRLTAGTSSGEDIRFVYKTTAAATTVQIDACISVQLNPLDRIVFGPAFGKASNSNIFVDGFIYRASASEVDIFVARYSNANTFAQAHLDTNFVFFWRPIWLRSLFTYATNTFVLSYSFDGTTYTQLHSVVDANLSSLDQIGLHVNCESTSGQPIFMDCYSLTLTEV